MCECPSGKQCYCEALTAYAHDCLRHGVTIDPKWRQVTSCIGHAPPSLHTLHHNSSSSNNSSNSSNNSSNTYPWCVMRQSVNCFFSLPFHVFLRDSSRDSKGFLQVLRILRYSLRVLEVFSIQVTQGFSSLWFSEIRSHSSRLFPLFWGFCWFSHFFVLRRFFVTLQLLLEVIQNCWGLFWLKVRKQTTVPLVANAVTTFGNSYDVFHWRCNSGTARF